MTEPEARTILATSVQQRLAAKGPKRDAKGRFVKTNTLIEENRAYYEKWLAAKIAETTAPQTAGSNSQSGPVSVPSCWPVDRPLTLAEFSERFMGPVDPDLLARQSAPVDLQAMAYKADGVANADAIHPDPRLLAHPPETAREARMRVAHEAMAQELSEVREELAAAELAPFVARVGFCVSAVISVLLAAMPWRHVG